MKIYLAAQFKEQALMREWRNKLTATGHTITSSWLDVNESTETTQAAIEAVKDLREIKEAHCIISHTLKRGDLFTGGGRHIEYGYALALDKLMINVGGIESVFHEIPTVIRRNSIEEVIKLLKGY